MYTIPEGCSTRDGDHRRKTGPCDSGGAFGCALRRSELAELECGHIQRRDCRWVCVALVGKRKRIRTVPILPFVKVVIDAGTAAAGLSEGPCFGGFAGEKAPVRILAKARRVPSRKIEANGLIGQVPSSPLTTASLPCT